VDHARLDCPDRIPAIDLQAFDLKRPLEEAAANGCDVARLFIALSHFLFLAAHTLEAMAIYQSLKFFHVFAVGKTLTHTSTSPASGM
jgi:hypothetical protein